MIDIDSLVQKSQWRPDALFKNGIKPSAQWLGESFSEVYPFVKERTNYYRFLALLVAELKPSIALEIGVEYGIGSAMMAYACPETQVIGIDINSHNIPLRTQGMCSNYTFIHGDSTSDDVVSTVQNMIHRFGHIGLVFQDSSHHYEKSKEEFRTYFKMLDHNAYWICDDITPAFHDPKIDPPGKGMVQYFQELPGRKKLYKDVLHNGNTVGVIEL